MPDLTLRSPVPGVFGILRAPFFERVHRRLHVLRVRGHFELAGRGDFFPFRPEFLGIARLRFRRNRPRHGGNRLGFLNFPRFFRFGGLGFGRDVRNPFDYAPMDGDAFFRSDGVFFFHRFFFHERRGIRFLLRFDRFQRLENGRTGNAESNGSSGSQKNYAAGTVLPEFLPFPHEVGSHFRALRLPCRDFWRARNFRLRGRSGRSGCGRFHRGLSSLRFRSGDLVGQRRLGGFGLGCGLRSCGRHFHAVFGKFRAIVFRTTK